MPEPGRARLAVALLLWLGMTALAVPAQATHAVNHRYVVLGYVRDDTGRPRPGVEVEAVREKTGLAYRARTDADGFYVLVIHLHDEDLLGLLRITVGRETIGIRARFDPVDTRSSRGTRVDFDGSGALERLDAFAQTLGEYLKR